MLLLQRVIQGIVTQQRIPRPVGHFCTDGWLKHRVVQTWREVVCGVSRWEGPQPKCCCFGVGVRGSTWVSGKWQAPLVAKSLGGRSGPPEMVE
jgi:hypothetical protein